MIAMRGWIFASTLAAAVVWPLLASAQDPRQIIEESQKRGRAASQTYEGLLQVTDPGGKTTEKRWVSQRLGSFGASKTILRFTTPAEVKGVAILIVNHADRSADQWMWTPAIGRERRIALQDRSTRFFGTDFTFEDLEERDVDQFDYKMMGEGDIDGAKCWHIESTPRKTKSSQYSSLQLWVRQDNYVAARISCFSKDQELRRLNYSQIENVQGVWTARLAVMSDLKRKSRTALKLEKLQYNLPMTEDSFTVAALERGQ
jgi:Outer membrane lipoprotein-sorting protein